MTFLSLSSFSTTAHPHFSQNIDKSISWHGIFLFILSLLSIIFFVVKKLDKPIKLYNLIIPASLAGFLGGLLGSVSICCTNMYNIESNFIILSGGLTGMFLGIVFCSFYRSAGMWIGALISFTIGVGIASFIVFQIIPWNIIIWGGSITLTNFFLFYYKLRKACN